MRKKSVCIRIGARFKAECCNLVTGEGQVLIWANDIRYLGVYIVSASSFKCSLDNAKRSFYRSFNAIRTADIVNGLSGVCESAIETEVYDVRGT